MKRYSANQLLVISALFEKQAENATMPNMSKSFEACIKNLTQVNPTSEEWKSWLETNRSVLGNTINNTWGLNQTNIIYCNDFSGGDQNYAYITNKPGILENNLNYVINHVGVLRSSKPIPMLFFYSGHYDLNDPIEPLTRELAHDHWLFQAIKEIMGYFSQDQFSDFVSQNKDTINKIRKTFETALPKYLGGGADGVAFDIGDKVLKIFKDNVSYIKAKEALNRLHQNANLAKTEAMIYDVGVLGQIHGSMYDATKETALYYYIMEKMKPLDEFSDATQSNLQQILDFIEQNIAGERNSKWLAIKKMIDDPTKSEQIKKEVKNFAIKIALKLVGNKDYANMIQNIKSTIPLNDKWLLLYVEEVLMKYLTSRTDLHMGNIGVTSYGELRYYDPAFSDWTSAINLGHFNN